MRRPYADSVDLPHAECFEPCAANRVHGVLQNVHAVFRFSAQILLQCYPAVVTLQVPGSHSRFCGIWCALCLELVADAPLRHARGLAILNSAAWLICFLFTDRFSSIGIPSANLVQMRVADQAGAIVWGCARFFASNGPAAWPHHHARLSVRTDCPGKTGQPWRCARSGAESKTCLAVPRSGWCRVVSTCRWTPTLLRMLAVMRHAVLHDWSPH